MVLLTFEAYRFIRLGGASASAPKAPFPHKWAVMFLIAVGFWNFLGAGVFGFLINLPLVSYYEIGTQFTANHAHGSLMGVYGMLAIGFFVFVARYFIPPDRWSEGSMKLSFWSLNIGLAAMLFVNLVPIGMLQLFDSFQNGYWHARAPELFERFLGLSGENRAFFKEAHGDLFGTEFWRRMQERHAAGELIEVFPYHRHLRRTGD